MDEIYQAMMANFNRYKASKNANRKPVPAGVRLVETVEDEDYVVRVMLVGPDSLKAKLDKIDARLKEIEAD